MKRSTDRILTSHVGSLIRPDSVVTYLRDKQAGKPVDEAAHQKKLGEEVTQVVKQQKDAGIDIPSDGEFGKGISWSQYVLERMSGFERRPFKPGVNAWRTGADRTRFSAFYDEMDSKEGMATTMESVCVGPLTYTGQAAVQNDIDHMKAALKANGVEEGFLPVASPTSVIPDRTNEYYKSDDDILVAIAEAMNTEYKMITDAGLVVQLDDARLAVTYDRMVPPASMADYKKWVGRQVELINHSLRGIPQEMVRYHVCWGSWNGPHTTDVPLTDIIDDFLKIKANCFVIEGANPRHEHEWKVWGNGRFPKDKMLATGVISHATNVVEHPDLVAERLVRIAKLIGRENVMAGTDCGFAQGPFYRRVHPSIMWAKFEALSEGARRASKELWGK
ncbi:cobalamin-independent methionine synthase II family protein [Methylocella sp. CPCC 101449]|uniref:cobalamin-independent methionine synthase II family protein n=1 Tax=Methylocella sp. CPCC 101449 TaxID=2987531 RepID=UPI00289124C1|nr:cobalamin-independent methionine synthase II family protein [Methylocella sp. CPCC 101449]MDT2020128.1 cobalamin-independent methionine synthase II family protein [Methylocella sp. CPCC 101449]